MVISPGWHSLFKPRKMVHGDEQHFRKRELSSAKRTRWHKAIGNDTRRFNKAGELIGSHNGRWGAASMRFIKKQAHKSSRRLGDALCWDDDGYRVWRIYARW